MKIAVLATNRELFIRHLVSNGIAKSNVEYVFVSAEHHVCGQLFREIRVIDPKVQKSLIIAAFQRVWI